MPSIRDEFGRILDLRWSLARDQCASQPICALRVGPNRGKTPKSCSFKNEGIPEPLYRIVIMWTDLVLCYLHIPKSGGTSIRDVFSNAVPDGTVFDCYWALSGHTIEDLLWLSTAEKRAIRVLFGHYFFGTHTILERPATYA